MNSFLTNTSEITFLNQIKDNLKRCDSFVFSVSFIKKAGLVLLYKELESAIQRGCKGKLITSTYQNFTDIESLQLFLNLANTYDNFECHLDDACFMSEAYETKGFHSKGYVFTYGEDVDIIVGSSNITRFALLKNIEWDLLMKDTIHGCLYQEVMHEFNYLWNKTNALTSDGIQKYARKLNYAIERWDMDCDVIQSEIKPNYMQKNALKELNRYRAMGVHRAMTVCSAGSGKTYLSAFDALNFNPDRLLYIVHESSILSKARESFQKVFGNQKTYGMYTGDSKEINADFVFATNITMANNLELFSKDTFDYIVIDECHHAVAESYQKIISYFEPEFMLGLTATPERLDNQDVFSLFDQNVPYELRLRDAIINDLVVPFHYYGIRDTLVDYDLSKKQEHQMLAQIVDAPHCKFICDENDCAPDIMKFMNIKYEGKKASCYYLFLKEMQESNLPVFSDEQITFLQYLSNLLPLVRPYEYQVVSLLMEKKMHVKEMQNILSCDLEVFEHVIKFMIKEGALNKDEDGYCSLNVAFDPELKEHVNDLIAYGLTKYEAEQYQVNEPFITFNNYRMDQVQRKLLKDPKSNQKGTYIYGKTVVIFASLKKDASVEERKNYMDKFLSPSVFQWESMNHVSQKEYENLRDSEFAYVFVRKVTSENGMVLPFTYVGKGKLTNPRKQEKNQTYLFDIEMEEVLPDYLQYDFGLTRMN